MHADLLNICRLWDLDRAMDEARVQARELKHSVEILDVSIAEMTGQLDSTEGERLALVEVEAKVQRQLDLYIQRRDASAKLMEGGSALDYLTVQRQHEQCATKVDGLEEQMLEIMETHDDLASKIATLGSDIEAAGHARKSAHEDWLRKGRLLGRELDELLPSRTEEWDQLRSDYRVRYDDFRRRKKVAISHIRRGVCGECHVEIQPQTVIDLTKGRRVHNCRGCGRWLVLGPQLDEAETGA